MPLKSTNRMQAWWALTKPYPGNAARFKYVVSASVVVSWLCIASLGGPPVQAGAGQSPPKYQGTRECIRCHKAPTEDDVRDGLTKYFDLTEFATWSEKDSHSLAYQVLKNERSRRMGQLLGIKPESDASCVSCHAVNVDASQCAGGDLLKVQEKGVSCEVCHGAASNWIDDHWHPDRWRNLLTRQEKTGKGLVDLRDAVTRAKVCLSCHVGDAQEGKVVTHDMFAAGHPPVSGFEIETFLRAMPKHWKPFSAQPPEIQKQYADERDPEERHPEGAEAMVDTRMMFLGGLAAMKEYARLIGANAQARLRWQADTAAGKTVPSGSSATELAFYDCQACHHELTVDSWRQKRGYPGRPGRPALRAWPIALGRLAATACGEHRGPLLDSLEKFYEAVDKQPFGAPKELAATAAQLVERTDEAIRYLKTQRFGADQGFAILKAICAEGASELPDFETARQLGWTALVACDELPKKLHSKEIEEVLGSIKTELSLSIPSREEEMVHGGAAGPDDCVCVAKLSVPQTLAASAKYDPTEFQKHCGRLAELLQPVQK